MYYPIVIISLNRPYYTLLPKANNLGVHYSEVMFVTSWKHQEKPKKYM